MPGANFANCSGPQSGRRLKAAYFAHCDRQHFALRRSRVAWSQEKIGGAETVINNVQGNLPTGKQVPVAQGDSVFLNEAVPTGADSKANLVLNDNSNVTVGPGSTVKLDDFVYSGPKQPGTVALNMTRARFGSSRATLTNALTRSGRQPRQLAYAAQF